MDEYRTKLILFLALAATLVNARPMSDDGKTEEDLQIEKRMTHVSTTIDWSEINNGLDYFEGDIYFSPELHKASTYNAIVDSSHKWTNNEIPYKLEEAYGFEKRMLIFKSLSEFNVRTCVTFRPVLDSDTNYLYIKRENGCYSSVGMSGNGAQTMSIGGGCESKGTIQHESMHALGFWHEQSRYDRDNYVEILWENINEADQHNFKKYSSDQVDTLGLPYDYSSILHYGAKYFSNDGNYTIKVAPSHRSTVSEEDLGQRVGFTQLDLTKIRTLYNCDLTKYTDWSEWTGWSDCDNECFRHRWRFCNSEDPKVCSGEEHEQEACADCVLNSVTDCGQLEYTGWEGSVASPLFPFNYKDNANCEYTIKRHFDEYPIYLSFVEFNLEDEPTYCAYDKLKIFDKDLTKADKTLCGDSLPSDEVLQSSAPKLTFISDYVTTKPGFKAFYFNVPLRYHCPFEFDPSMYGWTQDKNDDFDWTWIAGPTPSASTGPSSDHSLGNERGHYIFIETSSPRVTNDAARIISPAFSSTSQENCIQFYYCMYGSNVGTLNVYAVDPTTGTDIPGGSRFSKFGNQGEEWMSALLPTPMGVEYKVVFEALRGGGFTSDIAIDDVRVFSVACSKLK